SLHDDVKDRMAIIGRASTYAALVKQVISIDQRRHQCRLESKSEPRSSSAAPSNGQNKPRSSTNPPKSNSAPNLLSNPAKRPESKPHVPFPKTKRPVEKGLTSAPTVPIRNTVLQTAPPLLLRKPKSVLFRSRFNHLIIPTVGKLPTS